MKGKMFRNLVGIALSVAMLVSMSACGNQTDPKTSMEPNPKATKPIGGQTMSDPIPAAKAFLQKSLWFEFSNDGIIDKDEQIDNIVLFDGNGNATVYKSEFKFSELRGKTEEEIIEMVKEPALKKFEEEKAKIIEAIKRVKDDLEKGADGSEKHKTATAKMTELYSRVEALEYTDTVPYKLHITTDKTGNNVKNEYISIPIFRYAKNDTEIYQIGVYLILSDEDRASIENQYPFTEIKELVEKSDDDLYKIFFQEQYISSDLSPDYAPQQVYDMYFRGFKNIVTIVPENHAGFTLDTIDTEGVEVD